MVHIVNKFRIQMVYIQASFIHQLLLYETREVTLMFNVAVTESYLNRRSGDGSWVAEQGV